MRAPRIGGRSRRLAGLAALALLAGAAGCAHLTGGRGNGSEDEAPGFIEDDVTAALGIPPLRAVSLAPGHREVRVWFDGGLVVPHHLYRVVSTSRGVTGELAFHWPAPGPEADSSDFRFEREMESDMGRRCGTVRIHDTQVACRARFRTQPDWAAVLANAESAGLWTIRDEDEYPGKLMVMDGSAVTVELRDGGTYRSYTWLIPGFRKDVADSGRAADVLLAFMAVDSLTVGSRRAAATK